MVTKKQRARTSERESRIRNNALHMGSQEERHKEKGGVSTQWMPIPLNSTQTTRTLERARRTCVRARACVRVCVGGVMPGNEAHHACLRTARRPGTLLLATGLEGKEALVDLLHFEDSALKVERKPVA